MERGEAGRGAKRTAIILVPYPKPFHDSLRSSCFAHRSLAFVDIHADMSSLSVTQFSSSFIRRVGRPWVTMTQAHYPETTRKIFFMNSPSAISVAWRIIGKFVSKGTKGEKKRKLEQRLKERPP